MIELISTGCTLGGRRYPSNMPSSRLSLRILRLGIYHPSRRPFTNPARSFRPHPTLPSQATATAAQLRDGPSTAFHPSTSSIFTPLDTFLPRHVGPRASDVDQMLSVLGYKTLNDFVDETIPKGVRIPELTDTDGKGLRPLSELELRRRAEQVAAINKPMKSYIGMG